MNKTRLLLLCCLLPLFLFSQETTNQTDKEGNKQGLWIGNYPNQTLRYKGAFLNNQPIGVWERYHENGVIKAHLVYRPNSDRCDAELFDEKGDRYAKGFFSGTKKDSTWNYYSHQKRVSSENYSNGKKQGLSQTYFENGMTAVQSNWVEDKLHGLFTTFYPSGENESEIMYYKGKREGVMRIYSETGQVEIMGQFKDDLADGSWKYLTHEGNVKFELLYQNGKLLNPELIDAMEAKELDLYERNKGKLKDPQQFMNNPEEYIN